MDNEEAFLVRTRVLGGNESNHKTLSLLFKFGPCFERSQFRGSISMWNQQGISECRGLTHFKRSISYFESFDFSDVARSILPNMCPPIGPCCHVPA